MVDPQKPEFEEARWIASDDVNVGYLLDVFTSIDANSDIVWDVCANFVEHLYWYKRRYTVPGPKIEGNVDGHCSKPVCLIAFSLLSPSLGKFCGTKEAPHPFLTACERAGERVPGCSHIGPAVQCQSGARSPRGRDTTAKEALGFFERFGNTIGRSTCWDTLARLLHSEGQLDAAEKAASHIRSTPSQGKAKNSSSVNFIEASAKCTGPSACDSPFRGSPRNCVHLRMAL